MTATIAALPEAEAATYAEWFASLAEPTRVRLLHSRHHSRRHHRRPPHRGAGISQSTCSHHVRKLADVGFLKLHKEGTTTRVTVNQACCVGLPHAAGYRTVGVRGRIARVNGTWHDTVLVERRADAGR